jgi:hypothetical protein
MPDKQCSIEAGRINDQMPASLLKSENIWYIVRHHPAVRKNDIIDKRHHRIRLR